MASLNSCINPIALYIVSKRFKRCFKVSRAVVHVLFFQLFLCRALFNFRQIWWRAGEDIVIHIGWVIICVIKDIWSHVCKMGRLEQAMTRGGNKWKWSGKTSSREKKKKKLPLGNLPDSLSLNQSDVLWGRRKHSFKAIFKGKCFKSLYCITSTEGHIYNILWFVLAVIRYVHTTVHEELFSLCNNDVYITITFYILFFLLIHLLFL